MTGGDATPPFLRTAAWSYVMDGGHQVVSLVVMFVLAALLGPTVFGLAAMGTVYITLIDQLQQQGMAAALIQRKNLTSAHLDTGFWLTLGGSALLATAGVLGAGAWARLNDTPELQSVIVALSPFVVLQGLTTVQVALLRRRMAFRALAARSLFGVLAGGAAGIAGAALGWGVYALVAQQLVLAGTSVVVLWAVSGWRPRWRFSTAAARDLLGFSGGAVLNSMGVFLNNRADALLIGLFFGPTVLGVYRLGSRMVDAVLAGLAGPVRSLALPELSPFQDDPESLTPRLTRLMRLGGLATLPALGLLFAAAGPLTAVLGAGWRGAGPVIQVLCVVGVVRALTVLDGPLMQAVGSPLAQAGITWAAAAVSAVTFTGSGLLLAGLAPHTQAVGIAAARALVYGSVITVIHMWVLGRYGGLAGRDGFRPILRPLLIGAATALVGSVTALGLTPLPAAGQLAMTAAAAVAAAAVLSLLAVPGCAGHVRTALAAFSTRRVTPRDKVVL